MVCMDERGSPLLLRYSLSGAVSTNDPHLHRKAGLARRALQTFRQEEELEELKRSVIAQKDKEKGEVDDGEIREENLQMT